MNCTSASHELLKGLVCSRLRMRILASLDQPMRLCELRVAVNSNAPNTSSKARDLQDMGLVWRDNGDYHITDEGKLINQRLSVLMDTVESIIRHREFWRDIFGKLPTPLLDNVHQFKDARLIKDDRNDPNRVQKHLLKWLDKAETELTVFLPANSREIVKRVESLSKQMKTKLVTLQDDQNLHYGLISSNSFTILFNERMDMALIADSVQRLSPSLNSRA